MKRAELCAVAEAARAVRERLDEAAEKLLPRLLAPAPGNKAGTRRLFAPFPGSGIHAAGGVKRLRLHTVGLMRLPDYLRVPVIEAAARSLAGPGSDRFSRGAHRMLEHLLKEAAGALPAGPHSPPPAAAVRLNAALALGLRGASIELRLLSSGPSGARGERIHGSPSPVPLSVPGKARLPDGSMIIAERVKGPPLAAVERHREDPLCEVLDGTRLGFRLAVRPRRAGERFHPLGAKGPCRLKSFLAGAGVERGLRDRLALVVRHGSGGTGEGGGEEIVWVAGFRPAHPFRVTERTRCAVLLRAVPAAGGEA